MQQAIINIVKINSMNYHEIMNFIFEKTLKTKVQYSHFTVPKWLPKLAHGLTVLVSEIS